ncbi:MAG: acetyl-CoA carboxylase biotin carboxyl carrier protein subunit [Calditrichaeota bacterium]|nr:MAG: acetyl-CoA carboxylase biotin carboxyl carrier protein subunit [Calditrichota bacterium]
MKEKELVLEINDKEYKVVINDFTAQNAVVTVNDNQYNVNLKSLGLEQAPLLKPVAPKPESDKIHTKPSSKSPVHRPKSLDDGKSVIAPLPGLISKTHIREGDVITPGQCVMILEAMKMENEVNATSGGLVLDIRFKEGDSVNQGDVLILLKPVEE